ncbi:MAG: alanyl-tRNA editing protein [Woeseiaceae bacterium]|nr:alanyl-tRNA editing protein [Woeseiaceae bacterium]
MTESLFREDSYLKECQARVLRTTDTAIVLDRTVFYPMGGGQPGDTGSIRWNDGNVAVTDTRYGADGSIEHLVAEMSVLPAPGTTVTASIDWDRRYRHMRMHTGLHLLGSVLRYGVTGGNISADRSRLDFDMEDSFDKDDVNRRLQALVEENHRVSCRWISDAELAAQPELVRTMSVQPPKGAGKVRLLEIEGVDLQPCGGTHLNSTAEVGGIRLGKVEKKGKHNRRVYIELD